MENDKEKIEDVKRVTILVCSGCTLSIILSIGILIVLVILIFGDWDGKFCQRKAEKISNEIIGLTIVDVEGAYGPDKTTEKGALPNWDRYYCICSDDASLRFWYIAVRVDDQGMVVESKVIIENN